MKKLLYLLLISTFLVFSGCVTDTIDKAVNGIPQHQFSEFGYNRAGNTSSGSVTAKNARFENGHHVIDELNIQHTNRFVGNLSVYFKDLKRPVAVGATSVTGN
jgi:hypothetical protein